MSSSSLSSMENNYPQYVSYGKVKKVVDVTPQTLKNWAKNGLIDFKVIKNAKKNTWLYNIDSVGNRLSNTSFNNLNDLNDLNSFNNTLNQNSTMSCTNKSNINSINSINDDIDNSSIEENTNDNLLFNNNFNKVKIIYTRISTNINSEYLSTQTNYLKNKYDNAQIITDIASSLSYCRPGLDKLINMIFNNKVSHVIITDKERICMYGYELFEKICKNNDCIIIIDSDKSERKHKNIIKYKEFFNDIDDIVKKIQTIKKKDINCLNHKHVESPI